MWVFIDLIWLKWILRDSWALIFHKKSNVRHSYLKRKVSGQCVRRPMEQSRGTDGNGCLLQSPMSSLFELSCCSKGFPEKQNQGCEGVVWLGGLVIKQALKQWQQPNHTWDSKGLLVKAECLNFISSLRIVVFPWRATIDSYSVHRANCLNGPSLEPTSAESSGRAASFIPCLKAWKASVRDGISRTIISKTPKRERDKPAKGSRIFLLKSPFIRGAVRRYHPQSGGSSHVHQGNGDTSLVMTPYSGDFNLCQTDIKTTHVPWAQTINICHFNHLVLNIFIYSLYGECQFTDFLTIFWL